jgi:hypothetical protein
MEYLERFLATPAGKVIASLLSVVLVVLAVYTTMGYMRGDEPDSAHYTEYVDSETGQAFRHKNEMGETQPLYSPFSKKEDAYPGEPCYWTASGKIKTDPTWVLLNETLHKPGPTFCPDCHRLVIAHNPMAEAGATPPPTEEEYYASRRHN